MTVSQIIGAAAALVALCAAGRILLILAQVRWETRGGGGGGEPSSDGTSGSPTVVYLDELPALFWPEDRR